MSVTPSRAGVQRRATDLHGNLGFLGAVFYGFALVVAAWGSGTAAIDWLGWPVYLAIPAVLGVEVGGVYLLALADDRRRKGEQAVAERLLSAGVAVGAIALNWYGHQHLRTWGLPMQAWFFGGMSALAYVIWLIRSGHRRRDELRAAGLMRRTGPAYGLIRWLTRPVETAQARAVAIEESLDLHESIRQVRLRKRMSAYVGKRLRLAHDKEMAEAVVTIYDPARLAADLARKLDWDGLSTALAAEMDPRSVLSSSANNREVSRPAGASGAVAASALAGPEPVLDEPTDDLRRDRSRRSRRRQRERRQRVGGQRDAWFDDARENLYQRYADALDTRGYEMQAKELMPHAAESDSGARTARAKRFRERYVAEVASDQRTPNGPLPPAITELLSANRAPGRA